MPRSAVPTKYCDGVHEPIFIERWLHDIVRRKVEQDTEYRRVTGTESVRRVTRDHIDRYHLFKLKKILAYAYEKSTFYRESFDRSGIRIEDVKSLDDLAKLPFTNPNDLAQRPYELLCVSLGDVAHVTTFASSGTTAPRKKVFCTEGDLETMTDFMAAGLRTAADVGEIVQIVLPSRRRNGQAYLLARGVEKMGGVAVVTGTIPTSEDQIRTIDEAHPTMLFGSTSRVYRITQEARIAHDLRSKGINTVFVTSEYLSATMRKHLRDVWGCDVYAHYGLTEMGLAVAVECRAHDGYHFDEADLLVEVVDPETGLVLGDDEEGELVFTTLTREAMPLIRYRTHDISRTIGQPCKCGAHTLKRIAEVDRRLEGIVTLQSGGEIYPAQFDELIFAIPEVVDYQLIVCREDARDGLLVRAETLGAVEQVREALDRAMLRHPTIAANVEAGSLARPRVEIVGPGELRRRGRAKKLIRDERL